MELDDIKWPEPDLSKVTWRYMVVGNRWYCVDDEQEMKEFLANHDFGPPN